MMNNEKKPLGTLLQILKDSLVQKSSLLSEIKAKSEEQAVLVLNPDVLLSDIDKNMEEKEKLIEKLSKLDVGFEALYESIRKELLKDKDSYKSDIAKIQQLISEIMEKSASIEAIEKRNKAAIESVFSIRKKELSHKKNASTVAHQYYKATNRLNIVNPQFLDKKK